MKKTLAFLLALVLILSLTSCGNESAPQSDPAPSSSEPVIESSEESKEEPLTDFELCAEYAVSKLEEIMKVPASLSVQRLLGVEADDGYIYAIVYTGKNSLGETNQDVFYLKAKKTENGFAVISLGNSDYASDESQAFTHQAYHKLAVWSYRQLDPETYRQIDVVEVEHVYETVEGELRGKNTSYEDAWNFAIDGDAYQKLVYFAESADLSAFSETYSAFDECKVTIYAFKVDNAYYDATIVSADAYKTAEDRLATFSFHDREFFKEHTSELTPLDEETVKTTLEEKTFSMRNNFGGDGDGTHTITFFGDGSLDAKYNYEGKDYTMYETWRIENGCVILTDPKGNERSLKPYQFDDSRFLLIDEEGDYSMVLTTK